MRLTARVRIFVPLLVVSCLFPYSAVIGEPVRIEQAQQVATGFLRVQTSRILGGQTTLLTARPATSPAESGFREIRGDDGTVLAYIAEIKPQGFVAISADTDITPVVAYSFRTSFPPDSDKNNPLYRLLTYDLKLRAQAMAGGSGLAGNDNNGLWDAYAGNTRQGPPNVQFEQWPPQNTTPTGGWLQTTWHQELPYNDFCPLDPIDGLRSYVGCVATAIAQIANYHGQCNLSFDDSDSYMNYAGIAIDGDSALYDFPSFETLNGYLRVVQAKYTRGDTLDYTDTAALSFACGVACRMNYSSEGSGANSFNAQRALLAKFGFHSADMTGGMSAQSFEVLRENIMNGLPVYLTMISADGGFGHAIVCDGYNTDGEYHLNFGWGAPYPQPITEVWYHLPEDLPWPLNVLAEAIVNVQPVEPPLAVDVASLSFNASPGLESAFKTLNISSRTGGLLIDSISSPEGFAIAYPGAVYSDHLDSRELRTPGSGAAVRVKFRPERDGGYYGTLTIRYNGGKVKHVALKGFSCSGGTQVPAGKVTGTWTKAGSPYFVGGDIAIRDNGVLTIEPGVRIVFVGPYSMTIGASAQLVAEGSQNSPIEFTACNRDVGWSGLRFEDSGNDDTLSYCTITYCNWEPGLISAPPDSGASIGATVARAAIHCSSSSPTITSCKIANNQGGAIYLSGSDARIVNTLIANNYVIGDDVRCGGIFIEGKGKPQIKNSTIVNNSPGGLFVASEDGIEVVNTILWGDDSYEILNYGVGTSVSFCDVQGGFSGVGNIDADPSFFSPSAGVGAQYDGISANWTLRSSSPCINAGRQTNLSQTDLAGNPRISSFLLDIGAYENQSELPLITIAPSATVDAGFASLDASSAVTVEIVNTGKLDFTIQGVSISDPNGVFTVATPVTGRILPPGEAVDAQIVFSPIEEKAYKASLIIRSTCSNAPAKRVTLRGVGVSGTSVPAGPVSGTWTKAQSPYTITGDIQVAKGRTLTIQPGVVVKFAGHFKFTVGSQASLRAVGTEQENILLTATDPNEGWFGLRFVNTGTDDVLEYCTIEHSNKLSSEGSGFEDSMGGAIVCYKSSEPQDGQSRVSSPTIRNCLITHNQALYGAGIMYADDSEAVIVNNRIVDNFAALAGGIYVVGARGTIANNVIAHNFASVGGGIFNYVAAPKIVNNTIVHNRPSGLHLDTTTMFSFSYDGALVSNNIIWENEIFMAEDVRSGEYDIRFNDVQGGWQGTGNINVDPLFADPRSRDYHLVSAAGRWDPLLSNWVTDLKSSPCIDAGDPASPAGAEPAPNGRRINMGAYGGTSQASKSQ